MVKVRLLCFRWLSPFLTQKKACNVQNTAKAWNQESLFLFPYLATTNLCKYLATINLGQYMATISNKTNYSYWVNIQSNIFKYLNRILSNKCEFPAIFLRSMKFVANSKTYLRLCFKEKLLRRTNVTILSRGLCHEIYPEFTTRMLCAGRHPTGGRDACQVSSPTSTVFQAIANSFFRS